MVLVVGATGVLGRKVVARLRAEDHAVRAMTRQPARAADLAALGAEVVQGDLTDPLSLTRACAGASCVIAAAHGMIGRGRNRSEAVDDAGHRALVRAAKAAGARHFVYLSALGASPDHPIDFFRTKHAVEEHLKESGLEWTIVRPSAFMEWHAHEFNGKGILTTGRTTLLGRGTKKRNFVAADDVATLVVRVLTDRSMSNRSIEIGSAGNYTDREVAAIYGKAAGITPRIRHVPPAVLRAAATLLQPVAPGVSRVMRLAALPDAAFDATFDPAPLLAAWPMRLTSLEEFVGHMAKK